MPMKTLRILNIASNALLLASPWENAVNQLRDAFTGPIARGLSLVAIVVGGLMFAFGEGGHKRMLAGIIFGVGVAIAAPHFLSLVLPPRSREPGLPSRPL